MMTTDELRARFLDFFQKRSHVIVPSDSLIPENDPTLLFTGAGMNQFKEYFLGLKKDLKRAASSQKCLRTADLDNVGRTAYHHSFFEMLGNFSFGDYFKQEAIEWAWEFMTQELRIPKERLQTSVYQSDLEAYSIWKDRIGLPEKWIAKMGDHDNFWPADAPAQGPNGPCGPCSEIFYDQGPQVGCCRPECSVECDCGRFAEIWNLVFTQFDRQEGGRLADLPSKNIDTGMGLERLACVMQGKKSNFEIDVFEPLVHFLLKESPEGRKSGRELVIEKRPSAYAICDHIRAATFAISDGVYPSNDGRGYVIRKLIRRAVWHGRQLGIRGSLLYRLVPLVAHVMQTPYPELKEHEVSIRKTIQAEEERFLTTLEEGIERTQAVATSCKGKGLREVPADMIFRLYDTYGFPEELTRELVQREGLSADVNGFQELLEKQREQTRGMSKIATTIFATSEFEKSLTRVKKTEFVGYDHTHCDATVLFLNDGQHEVEALREGQDGFVVFDRTPCYGESGGQVGDQGEILKQGSPVATIVNTTRRDHIFIHQVHLREGSSPLCKHDTVRVQIRASARERTKKNHTATHLLHAALRQVLGTHVRQAGSLVNPEKLRFDFTHFQALSAQELAAVEYAVNQKIHERIPVLKQEKPIEEAKRGGAIAFFGEKYGERVRVITIGNFSMELCGGTHVDNTSEIHRFKIISESSIASGTRRIEALTDQAVQRWEEEQVQREEAKKQEEERRKRQEEETKRRLSDLTCPDRLNEWLKTAEPVANAQPGLENVQLIVQVFEKLGANELRSIYDALKATSLNAVALLFSREEGKLNATVALIGPCAAHPKVNANEILKRIGAVLQVKGGGKKDLAQAGGKDLNVLNEKLLEVKELVKNYLRGK